MLARMPRATDERDGGFTLIELLVVMIIIGILAAIAIPVFLSQRRKAVDTSAKSDVSTLGKEVASYYVDGTADPAIVASGTAPNLRYNVNGIDAGDMSNGVSLAATPIKWSSSPHNGTNWCVQLTVSGGTLSAVSYSAVSGFATTACP